MPKTYKHADAAAQKSLEKVLGEHHPELVAAEVTIAVVMVDAGQDKMGRPIPAIKKSGRTCAATIRKTPPLFRVCDLADAVMEVDTQIWKKLKAKARVALLDHEVEHLEVVFDQDGKALVDAAGRPVLSLKPHDLYLGIFQKIVLRYGESVIDSHNLREIVASDAGQKVFEFWKREQTKGAK